MSISGKTFWLLSAIVLLGAAARFSGLESLPPSLNWDEVSHGYNAYSLFKTGGDEWGVTLPAIFRAFGDYKLPVYIYATVLSEVLFGLTATGVRFFSVISGVLLIPVTFLIARKIFSSNIAALFSAFLVALEPWTFFLSRGAFEANTGAFIFSLGVCLLLYRKFFLSALVFGLSVWTYNSFRIFTPLFLMGIGILYRREFMAYFRQQKKVIIASGIVLGLFLTPMFYQLFSAEGQSRFQWLNILDEGGIAKIISLRQSSDLPALPVRLLYNRYTYFTYSVASNYIKYFSPDFLYIKGGSHYQFSVPGHGLLYLSGLPFLLLGLGVMVFVPGRYKKLLLAWLLLAAVPGSITRDAPHTLRAVTFLPLPMLLTGFGASVAWTRSRYGSVISLLFLVLIGVSFSNYVSRILPSYRQNYSWAYQYGYRQAVLYIKNNYDQYDRIIFTKKQGEPHEFVLFYWNWDPQSFKTDPALSRYFKSSWYWVDGFSKFTFVNDWEMEDFVKALPPTGRNLIISSPESPTEATPVARIDLLDGQTAFFIKKQ